MLRFAADEEGDDFPGWRSAFLHLGVVGCWRSCWVLSSCKYRTDKTVHHPCSWSQTLSLTWVSLALLIRSFSFLRAETRGWHKDPAPRLSSSNNSRYGSWHRICNTKLSTALYLVLDIILSTVSRQLNVKMAASQCKVYVWFCAEIKPILKSQGIMSLDIRIHTYSDQRVETSYQDLNLYISCCSELVSWRSIFRYHLI